MHGSAIHALAREVLVLSRIILTSKHRVLAEATKTVAEGSQVILRHGVISPDSKYPMVRDLLVRSVMLQPNARSVSVCVNLRAGLPL